MYNIYCKFSSHMHTSVRLPVYCRMRVIMTHLVLYAALISLNCCTVLVDSLKPTTSCAGDLTHCGDNKCCCSSTHAYCSNFGSALTYIPEIPPYIRNLFFTNNSLPKLSLFTLRNLSNVHMKTLNLGDNKIQSIEEDAFKQLKHLQTLDLTSNSRLNVSSLWNSLKSINTIQNSVSLILKDIGLQSIDDEPFRFLRNLNISVSKIVLAKNNIQYLNFSAFEGFARLEYLDISMNKIAELSKPVLLRSLLELNLSANKIRSYPRLLCSNDRRRYFFPKLFELDISNNLINELRENEWNCLRNLQKLNLNGNIINSIPDNVFSNLKRLKTLFVSQQSLLENIDPHGLNSSSLIQLDLKKNHLNFKKMYERNKTISIFESCQNLEELDISRNKLSGLSDDQIFDIFSNLKKLKTLFAIGIELLVVPKLFVSNFPSLTHLYLDGNYIYSLKGVFEGVHSLQRISMAGNNLHVIEEGTFPNALMQSVKVLNFRHNPFNCACEMLWFRDWIDNNIKQSIKAVFQIKQGKGDTPGEHITKFKIIHFPDNISKGGNITLINWPKDYICRSPNNKRNTKFIDYHPTKESCETHDPLVIAYVVIASVLGVSTIIALIIYKNQWYIKYAFYKMKLKTRGNDMERQPLLSPTDVHFDGYVIYSDDDSTFVHNDLIKILEEKYGYKLHIWHRNAESGAKLEVMVDAIYNSDNVIAVISKQFMKDNWCQFAMDVAMDRQVDLKRDTLILIILEDVEMKSLSKYWCVILTKLPTAYWCENENDIKRSVFEQKCKQQLGIPMQLQ